MAFTNSSCLSSNLAWRAAASASHLFRSDSYAAWSFRRSSISPWISSILDSYSSSRADASASCASHSSWV